MSDKLTLAAQWRMFSSLLYPDAPAEQLRELEVAFYGGAQALQMLQAQLADQRNAGLSDDAGTAIMEGWISEIHAWARRHGESRGLPKQLLDTIAPADTARRGS